MHGEPIENLAAQSAPLAAFPVVVTLPVQWGDQDAFGHVNNVVYFRWMESARIEYMRRVGFGHAAGAGICCILASIDCNYRRPVTFPDTVHVAARVTRIGRSSVTMEHVVFSEQEQAIVADGTSTVVAFDYRANNSIPVSDELRKTISELEGKPL